MPSDIELRAVSVNDIDDAETAAAPGEDDHRPSSSPTLPPSSSSQTHPEGGYGWVVVLACSTMTFWFAGTSYSWGILQLRLVQEGLSSTSTLAFTGSLTVTCIAAFAIPNAKLLRVIGARSLGMVGIAFLGGGELLSGWSATSVSGVFVTVGVVMGIGTSMVFMVASATPAQYFLARRGLANGIVYGSGGLGGTVLSLAIASMLESVGTAWTFRILGLFTLGTGLPAAWMLRDRLPPTQSKMIDTSLFRDPRFILIFFVGAIATFPLFVPAFFLPLYSNTLGLSATKGAGLLAGYNLSSAIGRVSFGQLSDRIGPLNSLCLSLVLSAVSMLAIWPVSTSLGPLAFFAVVNGAANGGFFSVMPTVVGSLFGSSRVPVAMGMTVTGWFGGYLMGAPIAGYLLSAAGGTQGGLSAFRPAMFYAGGMALVATALAMTVRFKASRRLVVRV